MYNKLGRSVNTVVIPEYSETIILESILKSEQEYKNNVKAEKLTALDFYYNQNMDEHLEKWFDGDSLQQVPTFPQRTVPRFARARMLYKKAPIRIIGGEENQDYKNLTYQINSQTKIFSEISWLLGECHFKTKFNERKQRLEYEILPFVKEYFINGESEPFGYSYEIEKLNEKNRQFIFWSETRDGVKGMHFRFDEYGVRYPIAGNEDMINPYDINPISYVKYASNAMDVVRAAVQIGIAMTEIALSVRFRLGQPVFTGVDEGQSKIESGIDKAIILPEGGNFSYVSPGGSMLEMIEAVRVFANQAAENNHLRIRWGETSGNTPSGEALKILEIENLESRESDIPLFREWEHSRYEIDRIILKKHNIANFNEDYSIDFGEVSFPMSPQEERNWLDWKLEKGIMSKKELLLYFNPDMSEEELELKIGLLQEEKKQDNEATQPEQPTFGGLRNLGTSSQ